MKKHGLLEKKGEYMVIKSTGAKVIGGNAEFATRPPEPCFRKYRSVEIKKWRHAQIGNHRFDFKPVQVVVYYELTGLYKGQAKIVIERKVYNVRKKMWDPGTTFFKYYVSEKYAYDYAVLDTGHIPVTMTKTGKLYDVRQLTSSVRTSDGFYFYIKDRMAAIVEINFWNANRCLSDNFPKQEARMLALGGFIELQESVFEVPVNVPDSVARVILVTQYGYKENNELENMIEV